MPLDLADDKSTLVQVMGAIKQQAITWSNVDPDLCAHMVLLGHNELRLSAQYLAEYCHIQSGYLSITVTLRWARWHLKSPASR